MYVGVGVRDSLKNENLDNKVLFDFLISYDYSVGKEYFYSKNDVDESKDQSSPYLFVPNYSLKFQLNIKYNDFILSFRNNVYGKFVTDASRFDNLHTFTTSQSKNNNLDIFVSNQLFRQLNVFLGVTNVLNTKQNGIPYKDLSSIWIINPQYWRTFKFGLTFKLN